MRTIILAAIALGVTLTPVASQQTRPPARLFAPEELGLLEGTDRDDWQQPDDVMDQLGISDRSRVADIGAGGGWFTIRLARRAPNGIVYAEDIQPQMIESIGRRVKRERLTNVKTILGTATDPRLPANLDAVLMVDTYTQLDDSVVPLLKRIAASLAPNGQLGIVDFKRDGAGGPGPPIEDRVSPDVVKAQAAAAGLKLLRQETFLRYQYLLIFVRAEGKGQRAEER